MTSPGPLATPEPWNLVSEAYTEELLPTFEKYPADAIERAALAEATVVLDVATGPGTTALLAARRVRSVTAVDFSEPMLRIARARAVAAGACCGPECSPRNGRTSPSEYSIVSSGRWDRGHRR